MKVSWFKTEVEAASGRKPDYTQGLSPDIPALLADSAPDCHTIHQAQRTERPVNIKCDAKSIIFRTP